MFAVLMLVALAVVSLVALVVGTAKPKQRICQLAMPVVLAIAFVVLFTMDAEATGPRSFHGGSRSFDAGFNAGLRAARNGQFHGGRNVGPNFEFRFGPRGRLRSIR